jgi:Aldo/keto reductase family
VDRPPARAFRRARRGDGRPLPRAADTRGIHRDPGGVTDRVHLPVRPGVARRDALTVDLAASPRPPGIRRGAHRRALRAGQRREDFYGTPPLTRVRDYSRDGVRRSLEESLGRLGLDRVDIALIHDPDDFMGQAADETYPALAELRAQGVVRAIGAGMNAAAPLAWLIERCDLNCVLVAGRYTLLNDSAALQFTPAPPSGDRRRNRGSHRSRDHD